MPLLPGRLLVTTVHTPPTRSVQLSTSYTFPSTLTKLTRKSAPLGWTVVTWKRDTGLVGSVPARNSCRLFMPSPSGSHAAQDRALVIVPLALLVGWFGKYWAR